MQGEPSPAVRIRGLTVRRGDLTVLDRLDLEVRAQAITGLLGPSGCGKSTLMRAIVGVQRVSGGEVTVLGRAAGAPTLRRDVGYVTQAPSVYPDLTVVENLRYFATVLRLPRDAVERVLDEVDLRDSRTALVGRLSGGQHARVSLAVALLGRPPLLVLDEPTVGLDPVLRQELWSLFARLRDAGATLLVSSHVMDEAQRCDRLLLMREGRVLADDTLPQLLAATAAADVEDAFLRLVERDAASATAREAGREEPVTP